MNNPTTPKLSSPQISAPGSIDRATLELFAKWRAEDAMDDPEELRIAEQELAEFKKAMNENRVYDGHDPLDRLKEITDHHHPLKYPSWRGLWTLI